MKQTKRGQAAVLALSVLALTLIAPWGFGQDPEPLAELRRRAEQGDAITQSVLCISYYTEELLPQDYQEAVKWYRLAAEQGNAFAQYILGAMYAGGKGVPQDYVQAHKWINLAASRTTDEAEDYRSARDGLAKIMTASQIAEAQRLAREWQPKTWEQLKDK